MSKAKIIIKRPRELFDFFRKYKLYMNGDLKSKISHSHSCEFEVEPGKIDLESRIDWCSSNKLTIYPESGITYQIEVKSGLSIATVLIVSILSLLIFVPNLRDMGIVSIIISIFYGTYYMTSGRRKYLRMKLK